MIDLGEAATIDRQISLFRESITGEVESRGARDMGLPPRMVREFSPTAGYKLHKIIFAPLISAFGGNEQLLLAPDGDLTRLPFEVLPMGDERCLIDDYHISYVGAGRDVLRFGAATTGQPTKSLVAADPDFDLRSGDDYAQKEAVKPPGRQSREFNRSDLWFSRLPGTREEGKFVAAKINVDPWFESRALEARIKSVQSPFILHLATHGFFLEDQKHDPGRELRGLGVMGWEPGIGKGRLSRLGLENPLLRSGLALAGANTFLKEGVLPEEAEDGILTAEDVSGLDLLSTELVVLSACDTGLGEVRVGEGVFGLRRAFVLAGAKTLVMSLWKVPDQQTQQLMEDFYSRVLSGQPRAEALREAQIQMKAKYLHPIYWGAFICQGDPGPLPEKNEG